MEHSTSPWSGLGLGARAGTGGTSYEIPRYRERMGWDGQEGPRIFQTGTGGMSHGIPGHPTAKSDNPRFYCSLDISTQKSLR